MSGFLGREAEGKSIAVNPSAQGKVDSVVTSTGANNHVGVGGRVALQIAQAIICGKGDLRVKCSFYTGSHRSFVTATTKTLAGLKVISKEWIVLTTFGEIEKK